MRGDNWFGHPAKSNRHPFFTMITMLEKVCCCVCLTMVSLTSCSSNTLDSVNGANANSINSNSVITGKKLFYLDLKNPSIVQPFDAKGDTFEGARFVQVEVVEVVNPKRHPVSFQLHYQVKPGEKIYLGSFGLYPADNPGKFIVATQGKLKNEGAIVLSLVVPETVASTDTLKVGVRKIRLVKD